MNIFRRSIVIFTCLSVTTSAAFGQETYRVGDPLPQSVLEAWQKRREACRSVYWKLKVRELITKDLLNAFISEEELKEDGPRAKQDEWRAREFETWIDFPTSRIRNECKGTMHTENDAGEIALAPYHDYSLYDGESLQSIDPQTGRHWERDPHGGRGPGLVFEIIQKPLFWGNGRIFGPDTPYRTDRLNDALDPQKFRIRAVETRGNSTHLIVRTNLGPKFRFLEYEIDLSKDAAVVRQAFMVKGKLESEMNAVWSETDSGWQPASWTYVSYWPANGKMDMSGEAEVVERICEPDLSAVVFHVDPEAGETYWDEKSDTVFVKSEDGEADVPHELYRIHAAADRRRWMWIASAAIVLVCLGGGAWWWRRR